MTTTAVNRGFLSPSATRISSAPPTWSGEGWKKLDITYPPMSTAEPYTDTDESVKGPTEWWRKELDNILGMGDGKVAVYRLAEDTVEKILSIDHSFEPEIDATDDGGVTLIFENERMERELTVVIPEDGSRRLFAAISERSSFRLVGAIFHSIAIENLAHWLRGETQELSGLGLVLPSSVK